MRRALTFLAASAALFAASPAFAQKPVVTINVLPQLLSQLTIEEIQEDTYIRLEFNAVVNPLFSYDYEVTYNGVRSSSGSTGTSTVTFIHLDPNSDQPDPSGPLQSGVSYTFNIRPTQIIKASPGDENQLPGGSDTKDNAKRDIFVRVFVHGQAPDTNNDGSNNWQFTYDTRPPPAPAISELFPGENRMTVTWVPPSVQSDVNTYDVVYCPAIETSSTTATSTSALPCANPTVVSGISKTQTSFSVDSGLENGVPAAFAVRSQDDLGNIGPISGVQIATPIEVSDYFELYKDQNGDEEGGFCFIATAATGSYAHPTVQVLRAFRDRVLKRTPIGTLAVWAYYHASPPLARVVAKSPELRSSVRLTLLPIASVALFFVLAPFGALGVISWRVLRRRRRGIAFVAMLLLLGVAQPAKAYESSRPKSSFKDFGLAFIFKGGPYLPKLAEEQSFAEVFAEERNADLTPTRLADANALYALGMDFQLFRAFGTAGVGGSFGFMQFVGRAVLPDQTGVTHDTTVFNLMPFSLTGFYRFDVIADRTGIPFVPYLRGGLAYDVWWVTNGRGHISRWKGSDKASTSDDVIGRGGKFGFTGTLGLSVLLNVFEPEASKALFDTTAIRGTYFFIEYQIDQVHGIPSGGFDLSDATWNLGLYLEL